MRIVKYLKKYTLQCCLIFCLLIAQTALTLASPYITSDIINIGLYQKGITNCNSPYLSKLTFDELKNTEPEVAKLLDESYDYVEEKDAYKINPEYKDNIRLSDSLVYPMAFLQNFSGNYEISYKNFKTTTEEGVAKQLAIQKVIDELEKLNINIFDIQLNYLLSQGAILLLIGICLAIVAYFCQLLIAYVSLNIEKEKRKLYFSKLIQFTCEDINKFGESSLITRATNDISYITAYVRVFLNTVLSAPISLIVGVIFAIITAPKLTWIIIVASIAIIIAAVFAVRYAAPVFSKMQWIIDFITLKSREIITGQYVIRGYNNQAFEESKFDLANQNLKDTNLFLGRLMAIVTTLLSFGFNLVSVAILIFGGFFISTGEMLAGNIIAFVSYSTIILGSISSLGLFIGSMPRAKVCMNRIDKVILTNPKITSLKNLKIDTVKTIEFKNVGYSYNDNKNMIINRVSFSLRTGESLGIVGTIGSGKSTIAKLLLRLEEATKGDILVNNINIKNFKLPNYKSMFGFAPQNSFLFKGTIKDNICFGVNNKIDKLINYVCLDELVNSLDDGIDSSIEQKGQNISGGQQQRISIARALSTNAPVFIFDDCFSALDFKIEKEILDNIYKNFETEIKIIISSRLSSVKNASKILVLDEGNVVGYGSHEKLMKNCAEYIKIYKHQYSDTALKEA